MLKKWSTMPIDPQLSLPQPNPFIPTDFTIKAIEEDKKQSTKATPSTAKTTTSVGDKRSSSPSAVATESLSLLTLSESKSSDTLTLEENTLDLAPDLLIGDEYCTIWHHLDRSFGTPRSSVALLLQSPAIYATPMSFFMAGIFTKLWVSSVLNQYLSLE
jgi:secreted Zn-dependent insulinase-like peptidase